MQKLENLEITKVAFVPEGDNKKADVLLFKSKQSQSEPPPLVTVSDEEKSLIKRVFSALWKTFGFENTESVDTSICENVSTEAIEKTVDLLHVESPLNHNDRTEEEIITKGVDEDMKIDKSKLTPEEIAQLEAIEKKAGIADDTEETDTVEKSSETVTTAPPAEPAGEDIYKGLHPAVAEELRQLRKRTDEAEARELQTVAKKYEILGKKPEELAKTLKTLKEAGGTAYDDMISVLDQSLAAVEKSGIYSEIGRNGDGSTLDAWGQIEKHADEILKSAPNLTRIQAIDKACEQHPELVAAYESDRKGV